MPKRQSELSSARRSQGHTLNKQYNIQYSIFFQVKGRGNFTSMKHTMCFVLFPKISVHTIYIAYVTNLLPSRQYWVINIKSFVFPHESICVIPHQCFFVFLVWHDNVILQLIFYFSFRSSSFVCNYNCRFSYCLFLNSSAHNF